MLLLDVTVIHLICWCDFQVLLTTPTTPIDRMRAIAEASEGFLYLVRFLWYPLFGLKL